MVDVLTASIKDKLWHRMRGDLAQYAPQIESNQLLMCCACGRFLEREEFSLEHIIPKRALKLDPEPVRRDPATPENVRAGNLLLCTKPLLDNRKRGYANGCNSWKGRFYDKAITDLLGTRGWISEKGMVGNHLVAALCLGYLAMVAKFGYRVVLMQSGLLLRKQFFHPFKVIPGIPDISQMILGGSASRMRHDAPVWGDPFSFSLEQAGLCYVVARNFGVALPVSQDPRRPVARHLRFAPAKYKLRPDFTAVFD